MLEPIRKTFAKVNGVKPALFSPDCEGACPTCKGAGVVTDLAIMAGVATTCEECEGKRFQASVLQYRLGGRGISKVFAMPVAEAAEFFPAGGRARTARPRTAVLDRLAEVGLGYLSLGQPLTTLSGGERQRLKLATGGIANGQRTSSTSRPGRGTPPGRRGRLPRPPARPVGGPGKTVIVVEHHQAVMAHTSWMIDLGPGAGHDGGKIVFEGTPAELVADRPPSAGRAPRRRVGA